MNSPQWVSILSLFLSHHSSLSGSKHRILSACDMFLYSLITSWQKTDSRNISAEACLSRSEPTRTRAEESLRISNDFIIITITNICFLTWPLSHVSHLFFLLYPDLSPFCCRPNRLIIGTALVMLFSSQFPGDVIISSTISWTEPGRWVAVKAGHWFTAF